MMQLPTSVAPTAPLHGVETFFPLAELPAEIRVEVFRFAIASELSIHDRRLPLIITLASATYLAASNGAYLSLILTCRTFHAEIHPLLWENTTVVALAWSDLHFGALRNAEQAFRAKIKHLFVNHVGLFWGGIVHCLHLRCLTISTAYVDAILHEAELAFPRPHRAIHTQRGRTLEFQLKVVSRQEETRLNRAISTESGGHHPSQLDSKFRNLLARDTHPFLFLSHEVTTLPQGCKITVEGRVTSQLLGLLRTLHGFTFEPAGIVDTDWRMRYDGSV